MGRSVLALSLSLFLIRSAAGAQQAKPEAKPAQPMPQIRRPRVVPSEFNVRVESDVRTLVVMAAINVAGFDYEPAGQSLSPARAELRRDLAKLDPQVKENLAAFYKSHRRAGVDEGVDALRYAALSLLMAPPPSFEVYVSREVIPADVSSLLDGDFPRLTREFYLQNGIKQLLPKYLAAAEAYAGAYRLAVGEVIYETLDYFHATPQTIVNMRPLVIESGDAGNKGGKKKPQVIARNRTRQLFVIPDPLSSLGTSFVRDDMLNQKDDLTSRKIGDDYIVVVGPSRTANTEAVRQALIRFVIDTIVERHLKASLEYKDQIVKLVATVPTAAKEFGSSVYLVIRESLARAAEARMRRIQAIEGRGSYSEDDAIFDLAQAYLRGGVLAFHFYESLIGLEKVGISIEDFFDQMVATAGFDREAARPKEFEPIVARVSAARGPAPPAGAADSRVANPNEVVTQKILASNDLIRLRRFAEARPLLEEVLAVAPNNARALFGMAQVVNQTPSGAEVDPKGDEDYKIQGQHDRLEQAVKLYRKAIESASLESERWLIQWSHVLIGRIMDFQEFRADAIAEYEKAIALGDVPNGAYKEALEGKQRPYGQK